MVKEDIVVVTQADGCIPWPGIYVINMSICSVQYKNGGILYRAISSLPRW